SMVPPIRLGLDVSSARTCVCRASLICMTFSVGTRATPWRLVFCTGHIDALLFPCTFLLASASCLLERALLIASTLWLCLLVHQSATSRFSSIYSCSRLKVPS